MEEGIKVEDEGSPGGPRTKVETRLSERGVEIMGEDGKWHLVESKGLGKRIIEKVWGIVTLRNQNF